MEVKKMNQKVSKKVYEKPVSAVELSNIFGFTKHYFLNNREKLKIPHMNLSKRCVRFYESEVREWLEQRRAV